MGNKINCEIIARREREKEKIRTRTIKYKMPESKYVGKIKIIFVGKITLCNDIVTDHRDCIELLDMINDYFLNP